MSLVELWVSLCSLDPASLMLSLASSAPRLTCGGGGSRHGKGQNAARLCPTQAAAKCTSTNQPGTRHCDYTTIGQEKHTMPTSPAQSL
jgi:hypothetical protein